VGFQQEQGSSRVFVRTSEPVSYRISEGSEGTLLLELENTEIDRRNNLRPLNTSFFEGPVAAVRPRSGPGRSVLVEIQLKEPVPYQARQEGNVVSLEFPRSRRQ
jgi:colicin import membrane protein